MIGLITLMDCDSSIDQGNQLIRRIMVQDGLNFDFFDYADGL
ncbi:hypothetical protein CLV58_101151 [Spirosoma oryzae]|uniref:Uncharacterized protein n=1 Tax=Spirosoma oryzae TaxID=1469603 RepID=A0A2T0TN46_9BACT|nr:hypothetical protein CLV58_101151 [Spirosoma oryzae]